MSSKPLISIIIPVLEEAKIIENTLKRYPSELLRKYSAELIISDGGSNDNTVVLCKDKVNKVFVHKEESRQTIAEGRNKGAELAEGEILFFINADTEAENLENLLKLLISWDEEGSPIRGFDALATTVLPMYEKLNFKDKFFYFLMNKYFNLLNVIGVGMGRGECQIVKKEIFYKVGCYNDKIVAGEDFDLYRRIAKAGKVKFLTNTIIYESPRRFKEQGYLKTLSWWFLNSMSVLFAGKSVSKVWKVIR